MDDLAVALVQAGEKDSEKLRFVAERKSAHPGTIFLLLLYFLLPFYPYFLPLDFNDSFILLHGRVGGWCMSI